MERSGDGRLVIYLKLLPVLQIIQGQPEIFVVNRYVAENRIELLLKILNADGLLAAIRIFLFGAMVVDVFQNLRVCHLRNVRQALGADSPVPRREFILAVATDDLMDFLGGYHRTALAATHETGERELPRLRLRLALPAQKNLAAIELLLCDHWRMLPFVKLIFSSFGVAPVEISVIKRFIEYGIHMAHRERLTANPLFRSSPQAPFVRGNVVNFRDRVCPRQKQVPHLADEIKTLRISDYGLVTNVTDVSIADGGRARPPALV